MERGWKYVVISPVKDEERNIDRTLQSVVNQNVRPVLWLIVDDGSKDSTPEIVRRYVDDYPFIRLVHNPYAGERQLAFGEVRAFNWGCTLISSVEYDFIVKLDCDLSFGSDYFEKLLDRFRMNEKLGIASGIYLERNGADIWKEIVMPYYHAAGASKVIRRACFEEIGGFVPASGWDTADEIKALTRGWKTCHFSDLKMRHHKREGSSMGVIKTGIMHGEAYYRTGGSKLFFMLKVIHRVFNRPCVLSALSLSWGYMRAIIRRKQILVTETESRFYKALLYRRLKTQIQSLFTKQ